MARERKAQKKAEELDEARLRELIASKAHELYERRGGSPGQDLNDWLEAERLVRQEHGFPQAHPASSASAATKTNDRY